MAKTPEGYYEDLIRGVVSNRRWLTSFDVAPPATHQARALLDLGAREALAIAAGRGAGPLAEGVEAIILDAPPARSMMENIRASQRLLEDLPAEVHARVDRFDPEGSARVVRALFSSDAPVAGRRCYGGRPAAWRALEDKLVIDALWDEAGVPRAPRAVTSTEPGALRAAAAKLDQGLGTVWAGDNKQGWHGGAFCLRWVRSAQDAEEAQRFFAERCDAVRVMPFLEGVPCSIHGLVFGDHVAALRPCEMLVLRQPGRGALRYAAAATFWEPSAADRAALRATARRVGAHLRARFGYRGAFTIDGVMSAEGFRPTELNPRFGAALAIMSRSLPRLPLYLIHLALVEGEELDWRAAELEARLLAAADAHPAARVSTLIERPVTTQIEQPLRFSDGRFEAAASDPADATLILGPAATGGFLSVTLDPERTPRGPSIAPRAAAALRFADEAYGLGLGPLEPAREVRP